MRGAAVDPGALEDVLRCGERGGDVAARDPARGPDELLAAFRFVDGEDRLEALDVDLDRRFRRKQRLAALRGDDHARLADESHDILGEQQLVLEDRAEEVVREIVVRVKGDDSGDAARGGGIERADPSVRDRRPEKIDEQLVPGERHVVDVQRFAGDMSARGVVWDRLADAAHAMASYQNFDRMFSASCARYSADPRTSEIGRISPRAISPARSKVCSDGSFPLRSASVFRMRITVGATPP